MKEKIIMSVEYCDNCKSIKTYKCVVCKRFTPLFNEKNISAIYCMYCSPEIINFSICDKYKNHHTCERQSNKYKHKNLKMSDIPSGDISFESDSTESSVESSLDSNESSNSSSNTIVRSYNCEFCNGYDKSYAIIEGAILCSCCVSNRFNVQKRGPMKSQSIEKNEYYDRIKKIYQLKKELTGRTIGST